MDWNFCCHWWNALQVGHTLRGCVDWNLSMKLYVFQATRSHPAWVCGLKLLIFYACFNDKIVTPCVGVWIETLPKWESPEMPKSHPAWVCGLKLGTPWTGPVEQMSHPAWVCGLKLLGIKHSSTSLSHTLRGCVDWNRKLFLKFIKSLESHPAWVCGLKLGEPPAIIIILQSHPAWVCGLKHPYYNRE